MAIRLRPFDDSLPASIDSRVKERKQGTNILFNSFFILVIYLFIYLCIHSHLSLRSNRKNKRIQTKDG